MGPLAVAPLYRTEAVPPSSRPTFLNTAAVGTVPAPGCGPGLGPAEVLALGKALELAAGRRRSRRRFEARPLDVDLVLYGRRVSGAPELTLPHPRLSDRRFMLEPLAAIAPDLPVPPGGETVGMLLASLGAGDGVTRVDWPVELDPRLTLPPAPSGR